MVDVQERDLTVLLPQDEEHLQNVVGRGLTVCNKCRGGGGLTMCNKCGGVQCKGGWELNVFWTVL